MFRILLAALALATPSLAAAPGPVAPPLPLMAVKQIYCYNYGEEGGDTGTAFMIGPHTALTAWHVVAARDFCTIDGAKVKILKQHPTKDIAVIRPYYTAKKWVGVNCNGFNTGEMYWSVGWAKGKTFSVNAMTAWSTAITYKMGVVTFAPERVLMGKLIPGMSGGPMFNKRGYVVGMNNAYITGVTRFALSREIKDTYLCGKI